MSAPQRLGPSSENTRSAVFDMIRSSGSVSRIELAEMSGLTATSITRIIKSLIEQRLVVETGFGDPTGGKRRSILEINPHALFSVGVSLDEARLTYVITDLGGSVVGHRSSTGVGEVAPAIITERIVDELREFFTDQKINITDIVGVGIAGAGLDLGAGAAGVTGAANEWESFPIGATLEARLGLPVVRDNDAACAALGQFWAGRMSATEDFATLYMSAGFGLGIMHAGSVARGASSNVGEVGHMVIDVNGPDCWCGSRGCLEIIAGPRAIVARGMQLPSLVESLRLWGDDAHLSQDFRAIAQAAMADDTECRALIGASAHAVGIAILSVSNLLDLGRLYLAGPGFEDAGPLYVAAIEDIVSRFARTRQIHRLEVGLADLGLDAAAVGAASLALQYVLTPHSRRGSVNKLNVR
jgi:predicted NBD/HSP70 family sugar kinase